MRAHPTAFSRLAAAAGTAALAAAVAACGSSSSTASGSSAAGGSSATTPLAAATLNGDGSTFQNNFDDAAIEGFTKSNSAVTINYNPVGSGQGQSDLEKQLVDFAGSDVVIPAADQSKLQGGPILYFPIVSSPITLAYKLSGVTKLQLSAPTVAKIFSGAVKTWNDPAIGDDNPGVTLPPTQITVVHRSDGSGTTANFTEWLKAAGGTDWTLGSGKTVNWPTAGNVSGGKGNAGVIGIIKPTDGAIGYADFSDAASSGLSFASIKNAAGTYVAPTLAGASAALNSATVPDNLVIDPINAPGADAYPITSPTFIIVYSKQTNPAKGAALKAFLTYIEGPGQALAANVNFAQLPTSLSAKAAAQVAQITGG